MTSATRSSAEKNERGWLGDRQVLLGDNFADEGRPGERLDRVFSHRAETSASHPAVISAGRTWTYAEMDQRANQLARLLIEKGVRAGDRVALLLDRSAETYIAVLAVMRAGAAFVPLATAFPPERMSLIIEDAGIRLVLTIEGYLEKASQLSIDNLLIDRAGEEVDAKDASPLSPSEVAVSTDDTCYILYTSGTTGKPKGVVIRHQSICNFVRVAAHSYGYKPSDRVYQGMTIAFDFSTEEIWVPFAAGATIVPAAGQMTLVGEELAEFLRDNEVTCMACSPTLLSSMESDVPSLRLILVGGEACPQNLVARWATDKRKILNTYGPTEATVTATMAVLTPDKPVTIGKPLPTYSTVILNPDKPELMPVGEMGELGLAGIGVAVGYLNRPELTDEKFINDFLDLPNNPSHRIYRTGDLCVINANGEVEYHGRIDTQVKIRGYRIETGEIEAILLDQPQIAQAAVTTFEVQPGRVELVGYYALKAGVGELDRLTLTRELKRRLPDYMVPTFLEQLAALPMTVSDKIDTRRLPKPTMGRVSDNRSKFLPTTEDERFLAAALADVLKAEEVYVEDNFFDDLGANSLLLAHFCSRVRTRKEWAATSMRDIYANPSIAQLLHHFGSAATEEPLADEIVLTHRASSLAYWATGAAQLAFYGVYTYVGLWLFNYGLMWLYEKLDDPLALYIRCVILSGAVFFAMTGFSVAAKWILVGRWKEEIFPIWSWRYYRFWVVKTLIRSAPVVLFRGSPLYSLYLKLLGAKLGSSTAIESKSVPVCTDLISIGENTILRKETLIPGFRAEAGYIHTGRITIGRDAFVGVGSALDIDTKMGDGSQLGHGSSLQRGQVIPDGEHWHGSPAVKSNADYSKVRGVTLSRGRRIIYEAVQLIFLFTVITPLPLIIQTYWENVGDGYQETIGLVAIGALVVEIGGLALALLLAIGVPRLFRRFLEPGKTYSLYGVHYFMQSVTETVSNSRLMNLLFGDSSAIVHYIRAVGWNLNTVVQTGSNFGTNTLHDNPFMCDLGSRTMVSDGLYMINVHKSASSFSLAQTRIGDDNYFGNNIYYPPDGKTGNNVLLGTKVMVPIEGPMRENIGLLGSPPFEIPRMVKRDLDLIQGVSEEDRRARLPRKNLFNLWTGLLFLGAQFLALFLALAIWDRALNYYTEWGGTGLFIATVIVTTFEIIMYILIERASLGFGKLKPMTTTIYEERFWRHERHWKLSDSPIMYLFAGTPFRPLILRAVGVKMGKRVYDGGANLTERSLVEIGDDATLNEGCVIQAHSLEEGAFKSDFIRIGKGCTLGPAAFVHYGVVMGEGSIADTDSFVMKGEALEPNTIWRGNPAKLHSVITPIREGAARTKG